MTPEELKEHLSAEHHAPAWVLDYPHLPEIHEIDHQTRPCSGYALLEHDHDEPPRPALRLVK